MGQEFGKFPWDGKFPNLGNFPGGKKFEAIWAGENRNFPLIIPATSPINLTYLFFEKVFLICQHIVLEQHSLESPDDLLSVTTKLVWVLLVAGSFLLLTAM